LKCGFTDISTELKSIDIFEVYKRGLLDPTFDCMDAFGVSYSMSPPSVSIGDVSVRELGAELIESLDFQSDEGWTKTDMVNQPPHYQFTKELEVIDVIKIALERNMEEQGSVEAYLYSQVLKYLLRCGCKGNMKEDLEKAEFYLKDLVKEITNG